MNTIPTPLLALIATIATQHGLPVNLVKAIVKTESAFETWAFRFEPAYKWLVGDKLTMSATERTGQMCSFGLMQVMGGVAREMGFTGYLPQLCDPATGLDQGCRHLKHYYQKYSNWPDTIASYNAGSPRKVGETYVNQGYVDKVYRAWNAFDAQDQL